MSCAKTAIKMQLRMLGEVGQLDGCTLAQPGEYS